MALLKLLRTLFPLFLAGLLVLLAERHLGSFLDPGVHPSVAASGIEALEVSPADLEPRYFQREFRVLIDPGHRGLREPPSATGGDNWSGHLGRFLSGYHAGWSARTDDGEVHESVLMLDLARELKRLLDLTLQVDTWPEFQEMIREIAGTEDDYVRVIIESSLLRDTDLNRPNEAGDGAPDNGPYRIFDSPVELPAHSETPLQPGRISRINRIGPDLVVSLHMANSPSDGRRGYRTFIVPSYGVFDHLRRMETEGERLGDLRRNIHYQSWLVPARSGGRVPSMQSAMREYFLGYDPQRRNADSNPVTPPVPDRVQWRYRDATGGSRAASLTTTPTGPFWDRERSEAERLRRGDGPKGDGGDLHHASLELLRFVRYALWREHLGGKDDADVDRRDFEARLGPMHLPLSSNWPSLIHTNAIYSYLEMGYVSNASDRADMIERRSVVARGLAVGLYSLFAGVAVRPLRGAEQPQGRRIEWEAYTPEEGPGHFDRVRPVESTEDGPDVSGGAEAAPGDGAGADAPDAAEPDDSAVDLGGEESPGEDPSIDGTPGADPADEAS